MINVVLIVICFYIAVTPVYGNFSIIWNIQWKTNLTEWFYIKFQCHHIRIRGTIIKIRIDERQIACICAHQRTVQEHTRGIQTGKIPVREILVELGCAVEHEACVEHIADIISFATDQIPFTYILVERCRITKHMVHCSDGRYIPIADILIKAGRAIEHIAHSTSLKFRKFTVKIVNTPRIPVADIRIEFLCIVEHPAHVHDIARIPVR